VFSSECHPPHQYRPLDWCLDCDSFQFGKGRMQQCREVDSVCSCTEGICIPPNSCNGQFSRVRQTQHSLISTALTKRDAVLFSHQGMQTLISLRQLLNNSIIAPPRWSMRIQIYSSCSFITPEQTMRSSASLMTQTNSRKNIECRPITLICRENFRE